MSWSLMVEQEVKGFKTVEYFPIVLELFSPTCSSLPLCFKPFSFPFEKYACMLYNVIMSLSSCSSLRLAISLPILTPIVIRYIALEALVSAPVERKKSSLRNCWDYYCYWMLSLDTSSDWLIYILVLGARRKPTRTDPAWLGHTLWSLRSFSCVLCN